MGEINMTAITGTLYNITCEFCIAVRNTLTRIGTGFMSSMEITGRGIAASRLANLGYYEEARRLMLEREELLKEKSSK